MKLPIFKISRPRFWLYLFGPFIIGLVASGNIQFTWIVFLLGLYFLLPANLLIYGVNDLFDYETDKHNPKKQSYEVLTGPTQQKLLSNWIVWLNAPLFVLLFFMPIQVRWAMLGFLFFGIYYSATPIRAKTKPIIDSLFNILYVFPGIVGYVLLAGGWPPLQLVVAAGLWCMAMHAFSAVPDIAADTKARVATIATLLGRTGTLLFCLAAYVFAAVLSFTWLGWFSVAAGIVYSSIIVRALTTTNYQQLFMLYRAFPYINTIIGIGLFFWILLIVK